MMTVVIQIENISRNTEILFREGAIEKHNQHLFLTIAIPSNGLNEKLLKIKQRKLKSKKEMKT